MEHRAACVAVVVGALAAMAYAPASQAQDLGSFLKTIGEEAVQKAVDGQMGQKANPGAQGQQPGQMLQINGAYDFTPGPVTLFQQNFVSTPVGAMPSDIKTNGSGQVVTLQAYPGHWLELRDSSTYKLHPAIDLPNRFTIEFDVIPVAEKISDLIGFAFGFAHDNSVGSYISDAFNDGAINYVKLGYQNGGGGDIIVASSATNYNNDTNFDWRDYANHVMHVAIAVNGDQMQVYLDHMKIADSRLFEHALTRYFYFDSSFEHYHDAKLLVSNLRIGGFAPAGTPPRVGASSP